MHSKARTPFGAGCRYSLFRLKQAGIYPPYLVSSDFDIFPKYMSGTYLLCRGFHLIGRDAIVPIEAVVVVERAVRVDIPRIVRVGSIGSTQPPIPRTASDCSLYPVYKLSVPQIVEPLQISQNPPRNVVSDVSRLCRPKAECSGVNMERVSRYLHQRHH